MSAWKDVEMPRPRVSRCARKRWRHSAREAELDGVLFEDVDGLCGLEGLSKRASGICLGRLKRVVVGGPPAGRGVLRLWCVGWEDEVATGWRMFGSGLRRKLGAGVAGAAQPGRDR